MNTPIYRWIDAKDLSRKLLVCNNRAYVLSVSYINSVYDYYTTLIYIYIICLHFQLHDNKTCSLLIILITLIFSIFTKYFHIATPIKYYITLHLLFTLSDTQTLCYTLLRFDVNKTH